MFAERCVMEKSGGAMIKLKEDVIKKINRGEEKAFEQLYMAYYVYLCAVATKYVFRPEVAQQIVNDIFMNVWNNREKLTYPVNAYLLRSVQNRCLNYIFRKKIGEVFLTDLQEQLLTFQELQVNPGDHPLAYLENKEMEEIIYSAISALPPKCRDIFEQYLYQNKTYEEIAQTNHISSSTVRVQIKLGLARLKESLGPYYHLFILIFFFLKK